VKVQVREHERSVTFIWEGGEYLFEKPSGRALGASLLVLWGEREKALAEIARGDEPRAAARARKALG